MFLAGFGFFLQNFQLRIGTYMYVHKMIQYDLHLTFNDSDAMNHTDDIRLSEGESPRDVSFGALNDPVETLLGSYQQVDISFLDKLAALFPFLFCVAVIAIDMPLIWTRVMLSFFVLAVGKGFFAWITVEPDSNGWKVCEERLAASSYSVQWYSKQRTMLELFLMDPRSRLCADMMWSGHTYFVAIFAFGLHECVRIVFRSRDAWTRIIFESVVTIAACLQQGFEIYFVLKSHFHYTADVAMALLMTYLLYTNSTIAVLAGWWYDNTWMYDPRSWEEYKAMTDVAEEDRENIWLNSSGTYPSGYISVGCCCCAWSQHFIYDRQKIVSHLNDIETATGRLADDDTNNHLKLMPKVSFRIKQMMNFLEDRSILCGPPKVNEE